MSSDKWLFAKRFVDFLIFLMVSAIVAAMIMCGSGCVNRNDQLRGHNSEMMDDAAQAIEQTLKDEAPRLYAEHETLKRDVDDLKSRIELSKRDHPWKGAKIERSTPEKPVQADINLYCAYSAVVDKEEAKRKAHEERWAWWHWTIWWLKAIIYAAPFVLILVVVLWIRRRFFQFGEVQVKHIQATVKDKNAKRIIAGGSPVERVFKKIKSALPWYQDDETGNKKEESNVP